MNLVEHSFIFQFQIFYLISKSEMPWEIETLFNNAQLEMEIRRPFILLPIDKLTKAGIGVVPAGLECLGSQPPLKHGF